MKGTGLLTNPLPLTTTLPEVAPVGMVVERTSPEQDMLLVGAAAATPWKVTEGEPESGTRAEPYTDTAEPTGPELGMTPLMEGSSVYDTKLLAWFTGAPDTT